MGDHGNLWAFSKGNEWWHFPLRGAIIFAVVLVFLRLTGKRQIGQMTPFDLVLLLLISNAVQNSMNGGDESITSGIILAATLIGADVFMGWLTRRSRKVENFIEGRPELLVHNGHVLVETLKLMAGLRASGVASIEKVHAAILETNGRISVLERREKE
jgi:uncharacterized membrane protein YcaP (DUF421 family)